MPDVRFVPGPAQHNVDLDAYFARIGYGGPREATIDVLSALHRLHPLAIPFENVDPFTGRVIALDQEALHAKLIAGRRGGYCYEQNLLFMRVLLALGFEVRGLAARVLWERAEDTITGRTHMLLMVRAQHETWLADVGFGGLTQTAPLLFEAGPEQQTPHELFRIDGAEPDFRVRALAGGVWRTLYRFDLSEQHEVDYLPINYYLSTNPSSRFVTGLMAARALPDGRATLSGNRLTRHTPGSAPARTILCSAAEIVEVLDAVFGIAVPDRAAFAEAAQAKGLLVGAS